MGNRRGSRGLFRGEDLKGNNGNPDWLRLFQLISSEFALAEKCPDLVGSGPRHDRIREIVDLDKKLNAADMLDILSQSFQYVEEYVQPSMKPEYFRLEYDKQGGQVSVEPYYSPKSGTSSYDSAEVQNSSSNRSINTVLVEVDKVENLREAYPNYFGDVHLFRKNLLQIVKGKEAKEYLLPPQARAPAPPKQIPDDSWIRYPGRRKWTP